jgi:hypothetical protein
MRVRRWLLLVATGVSLLATSCTIRVGCTVYKFFEPGLPQPFVADRSACRASTPPPVISEVPYAVLLPIAAAVVIAGAVLFMRRRRVAAASA